MFFSRGNFVIDVGSANLTWWEILTRMIASHMSTCTNKLFAGLTNAFLMHVVTHVTWRVFCAGGVPPSGVVLLPIEPFNSKLSRGIAHPSNAFAE